MGILRTEIVKPVAKSERYFPSTPLTALNVQDAIDQLNATLVIAGSSPPAIVPKTITFAMSPYTVLATDYLLLCDTTTGAITIQTALAASRGNKEFMIKDSGGNAAANNITILRAGAETLDGLASYPIDTNYDEVNLKPITNGYAVSK
jgi:hypothetical protein